MSVNRRLKLALIGLSVLLCSSSQASYASPLIKKDRSYFEKKGDMIWEVQTDQKVIALTFDDGPDPVETNAILDLLNRYGARSTFFVIGKRVKQFPEVVQRVIGEGHEVANHTYSHVFFHLPSSKRIVREEIERTEQAIIEASGRRTYLFRPPGGIYDETIIQVSNEMGLVPIMWSWHQDTEDWNRPGVRHIINKVLNNVRGGDIILFHDHVEGKTQTVAALEVILPELQKRGYKMVPVSELLRSAVPMTGLQESGSR
jgi:peptidoglycan/xylan/chitin deacetylase (PgdA/CDA1 family)